MVERYSIHNDFLQVEIIRRGAELASVQDKLGREFVWQAGPIWERHAPNLFPIVGSLLDHEYMYQGKTIKMSHHGFARDADFDMLHQSEHSICFVLQQQEETLKSYPFEFTLLITYTLDANRLKQTFRVINDGNGNLPVSFGGHPAFIAHPIEEYQIEFECQENVPSNTLSGAYIAEQRVPKIEGNIISLDMHTFDGDALIFQNLESGWVKLSHKNSSHEVRVDIQDFPYLGIWAKPGAPFVCLEPWQGIADYVGHDKNILQKEGMVILDEGCEVCKAFTMEFTS